MMIKLFQFSRKKVTYEWEVIALNYQITEEDATFKFSILNSFFVIPVQYEIFTK